MKVLIVDDIKENLYLLDRLLKKIGYEVVQALNGEKALKALRQYSFDMIISDILMPVMSGFQLCRAVREDEKLKDILFVIYSATYREEEDEEFALKLGVDKFIRKPIEPKAFMDIIINLSQDKKRYQDKPERKLITEEKEINKVYTERLIQKLEKKTLDLEEEIAIRKQAEEEILRKNEELESFVYTVSHDLKSPLVSMYGFIEELFEENKDKFSENSKHMAERIVSNVGKMGELINDILDLSRVGLIVGPPVEIKLKELFEQLAMEFDKRFRNADIKLKVSQKDDCVICADRDQVHRVMDNLLSNAVKFMGDTDDRKIELICRKNDKSHVQICVKDNGIGIDRKYHETIFEIFQRLDVDKNVKGTGVGLALVKKAVETFGGRIWVESEIGNGAEFWVELPEERVDRRKGEDRRRWIVNSGWGITSNER
jgi:signal transduction histidine kinase